MQCPAVCVMAISVYGQCTDYKATTHAVKLMRYGRQMSHPPVPAQGQWCALVEVLYDASVSGPGHELLPVGAGVHLPCATLQAKGAQHERNCITRMRANNRAAVRQLSGTCSVCVQWPGQHIWMQDTCCDTLAA